LPYFEFSEDVALQCNLQVAEAAMDHKCVETNYRAIVKI